MAKPQKLIALIKDLRTYDHSIMSADYARKIGKAFGFEPALAVFHTDPRANDGKGIFMNDDAEGMEGISADTLAIQIVESLGLEPLHYFGRGRMLRENCDRALEHLRV